MEVDKAANKVAAMVADMVPDMVADMVADKKRQEKMTNMELTRLAHLLKLCEFIQRVLGTKDGSLSLSYCMVLRGISWYCMIYVV